MSLESQYLDTNVIFTILKFCNVRQITYLSLCYYILKNRSKNSACLIGLL